MGCKHVRRIDLNWIGLDWSCASEEIEKGASSLLRKALLWFLNMQGPITRREVRG